MRKFLSVIACVAILLAVLVLPTNATTVMLDGMHLPESTRQYTNVPATSTSPVPDGVIHEWEYATESSFLFQEGERESHVYYAYDDENIYFAYFLDNPGRDPDSAFYGVLQQYIGFPRSGLAADMLSRICVKLAGRADGTAVVSDIIFMRGNDSRMGAKSAKASDGKTAAPYPYLDRIVSGAAVRYDTGAETVTWEFSVSRAVLGEIFGSTWYQVSGATPYVDSAYCAELTTAHTYAVIDRNNDTKKDRWFNYISFEDGKNVEIDGQDYQLARTNANGTVCTSTVPVGKFLRFGSEVHYPLYVQFSGDPETDAAINLRILYVLTETERTRYSRVGVLFSTSAEEIAKGKDGAGVLQSEPRNKVYRAIRANGALVEASEVGGDYFAAVLVENVKSANFNTTVFVRPYFEDDSGHCDYGSTASFSVNGCRPGKKITPEELLQMSLAEGYTPRVFTSERHYAFTIPRPTETDDTATLMQGGCSDGRYYYQMFIYRDTDQTNNRTYVVKYDMETGTVVKVSGDLHANHANDVTYHPGTGKLYIVNNTPNPDTVTVVDAGTLEAEGTFKLTDANGNRIAVFSMNYNPSRNRYVVGISGGKNFRILDENFKPVTGVLKADPSTTGYTTQGCVCDDDLLYFPLYNASGNSVIAVYTWEGNYIATIEVQAGKLEPENMSIVNGKLYLACGSANSGGMVVYVVEIVCA